MTSPGRVQQKSRELVKEDRRIRKDTKTTPEGNYANNLNGLDFKSKDLNTTSSAREAPQAQSSKKRKLVEQLEVSVPVIRDLVTPVDQRLKQSEAKEPERKKKGKKRAVLPIPILPLSDNE